MVMLFLMTVAMVQSNRNASIQESITDQNDSIKRAQELVRDFVRVPFYNGSEFAAETYQNNATCKVINAATRFE